MGDATDLPMADISAADVQALSDDLNRVVTGARTLPGFASSVPFSRHFDNHSRLHFELRPDEMETPKVVEADRAGQLNAFITNCKPVASSGKALSGLTFSVKDNIDVSGLRTTCGAAALADAPQVERDATIVSVLRQAGAGFVGKNNMHEFALGPTGANAHFGDALNPWCPSRLAGGSSSGSASAVAQGLSDVSVGTDSGGSVRIPAAFCGVVGFKPSIGKVPMNGVTGASWSIDTLGFFARDMAQMERLWDVLERAAILPQEKRLRLGYLADDSLGRAENSVWLAYKDTLRKLADEGHELAPVSLAAFDIGSHLCLVSAYTDSASFHHDLVRQRGGLYAPSTRTVLAIGEALEARIYLDAQRLRSLLASRMESVLKDIDALLMPTVAVRPPRVGETPKVTGDTGAPITTMIRFTALWNCVGNPALALPTGLGADDLPTSIQIVGKYNEDRQLLAVAKRVEQALGPMARPAL